MIYRPPAALSLETHVRSSVQYRIYKFLRRPHWQMLRDRLPEILLGQVHRSTARNRRHGQGRYGLPNKGVHSSGKEKSAETHTCVTPNILNPTPLESIACSTSIC